MVCLLLVWFGYHSKDWSFSVIFFFALPTVGKPLKPWESSQFFFIFFFNFSTYFRGSQLSDFFFISLFLIQPDSIHFQLLCCSKFCRKILKLGFRSKLVYSFCPKIKYLVRFISSICLNAVIVAIFLFVPFLFMILKDIYSFKGKVFKDSYFLPLTK